MWDIDLLESKITHTGLTRMFLSEITFNYIWNSDYTLSNSRSADIQYGQLRWENPTCLLLGVF